MENENQEKGAEICRRMKDIFNGYIELGWSVIPLWPETKKPMLGIGQVLPFRENYATQKQINTWCKKQPQPGIGLITGKLSNLFVLDLDSPEAHAEFESLFGELPQTITVNTRPGRCQYYFKYPNIFNGLSKRDLISMKDVDLQIEKYYVAVPPTVHPKTGKKYQWGKIDPLEDGIDDLLDLPEEIATLLIETNARKNGIDYTPKNYTRKAATGPSPNPGQIDPDDLESIMESGVSDGYRGTACTKVVGYMMGKDGLDLDEAETLKRAYAWDQLNRPPMASEVASEGDRVRSTVKSIARTKAKKRKAMAQPVGLPVCVVKTSGLAPATVTAGSPPPPAPVITRQFIEDCLNSNEDGDAQLFIVINKNRFAFDSASKTWHVFKSHFWEDDALNNSLRAIDDVIAEYDREMKRVKNTKATGSSKLCKRYKNRINQLKALDRRGHVLKLASAGDNTCAITGQEWDQKPYFLPCSNGVIDLKTGQLTPGQPDQYLKTYTKTVYDPTAPTPVTFLKFMDDITNGDQDVIDYILAFFGSFLIGEVRQKIFPIFYGNKGYNGKTTLFETIAFVLGSFAGPIATELLMQQNFSRNANSPSPEILSLRGKRLVWASDGEGSGGNREIDTSIIKRLTGGDTLRSRYPYGKIGIDFTPSHSIALLCNDEPEANSNDNAFWKRAQKINFPNSFVSKPDPAKICEKQEIEKFEEKLKPEASCILKILVDRCVQYLKDGHLNPPQSIIDATNEYRNEVNLIASFIDDHCKNVPNGKAHKLPLYVRYKKWCAEFDVIPETAHSFGKKISQTYPKHKDNKGACYLGLTLLPDDLDNSDKTSHPKVVKMNR